MPTISFWMTHLPAGIATQALQSTDGVVVAVAEGKGRARIVDKVIAFGQRDMFVLPNWTQRSFEAETDCFLFCSSDRMAQERLGLWREERSAA